MANEIREGVELDSIHWPDDGSVITGIDDCESLTVRMQPGDSGWVPWVEARFTDSTTRLFNAKYLRAVSFAEVVDG